jgi:hypothetical protein
MKLSSLAIIATLSPGCATDTRSASDSSADTTNAPTIPSLYNWWSLPDSPGYYNIDERLRVDVDPGAKSRLSWGAQVTFSGGASAGHVELRDGIERPGKSAYFTFGGASAATPLSGATCTTESSIVECSLAYDWKPGRVYRLRLWVVDQSAGVWVVAVQDEATQVEHQIGTFTIPTTDLLMAQVTTFTDTFFMTHSLYDCDDAPSASATFYAPTGDDLGQTAAGFLTTIDPATCANAAAFFEAGDAIQSIND